MNGFIFERQKMLKKQEGQDGPGSLTWIFEITIAYFFFEVLKPNL